MILLSNTELRPIEIREDPEIKALFPAYTVQELAELQGQIILGVVMPPVVCATWPGDDSKATGKLTLVDGYNRLEAYRLSEQPTRKIHALIYKMDSRAEVLMTAIRLNAKRRHLTPEQRAAAGARLAELLKPSYDRLHQRQVDAGKARQAAAAVGSEGASTHKCGPAEADQPKHKADAVEQAAKEVGSAPRTVRNYKKLQDAGVPDVRLAVKARKISIEAGAKIADLPAGDQLDALQVALSAREAAKKRPTKEPWRRHNPSDPHAVWHKDDQDTLAVPNEDGVCTGEGHGEWRIAKDPNHYIDLKSYHTADGWCVCYDFRLGSACGAFSPASVKDVARTERIAVLAAAGEMRKTIKSNCKSSGISHPNPPFCR